jgi:hypothetical protein
VGYINDQYVLNPTQEELKSSKLDLVVADDIRVNLRVNGNNGGDNLYFVNEAFREQRANRAVNQRGYINDQYVLNPTQEELKSSKLDLVVAGTEAAVLIVQRFVDGFRLPVPTWFTGFFHQVVDVLDNNLLLLVRTEPDPGRAEVQQTGSGGGRYRSGRTDGGIRSGTAIQPAQQRARSALR